MSQRRENKIHFKKKLKEYCLHGDKITAKENGALFLATKRAKNHLQIKLLNEE